MGLASELSQWVPSPLCLGGNNPGDRRPPGRLEGMVLGVEHITVLLSCLSSRLCQEFETRELLAAHGPCKVGGPPVASPASLGLERSDAGFVLKYGLLAL